MEGDARREIGFDQAGEDIHARPLGGDDEVHADGARQLRQAHDRPRSTSAPCVSIKSPISSMTMRI